MLVDALTEVLLDVSDLEPPEPLVLTLEAANELKPGQYLRMLHRRDPCMLFQNLDEIEFDHLQREGSTTAVEVFIWRKNDAAATTAIAAITNLSSITSTK